MLVENDDLTDPVADSDEELLDFLQFMASRADNPRPFSPSQPSLHLRLEDGSRLAAAQDTARPSVVIRRHRVRRVTLADLVDWRTLSPVMASFLAAAMRARRSIVVSGGQGDGKTTLVRALCAEIGPYEAIGTFETEYELHLHELRDRHKIVHAWEARPGSGERGPDGRAAGEYSMDAQLSDSYRYNLSRQIVGEIRDEYDEIEEQLFQQLGPYEYTFLGRISLDDLNEETGLHLSTENAETLGGFIYGEMGHVPAIGEKVQTDGASRRRSALVGMLDEPLGSTGDGLAEVRSVPVRASCL